MYGNLSGLTDGRLLVWTNPQHNASLGGKADRQAKKQSRLVRWTNRAMHRWKEGVSGFGWMDGWTDGQPENIMPLVPKARRVNETLSWWLCRWKNYPNAFLVSQNNAFSVIVFENRHLRRTSIGTNVVTQMLAKSLFALNGHGCCEHSGMHIRLYFFVWKMYWRYSWDASLCNCCLDCKMTHWFLYGLSSFPIFGLWVFPGTCLNVLVIIYTSEMLQY